MSTNNNNNNNNSKKNNSRARGRGNYKKNLVADQATKEVQRLQGELDALRDEKSQRERAREQKEQEHEELREEVELSLARGFKINWDPQAYSVDESRLRRVLLYCAWVIAVTTIAMCSSPKEYGLGRPIDAFLISADAFFCILAFGIFPILLADKIAPGFNEIRNYQHTWTFIKYLDSDEVDRRVDINSASTLKHIDPFLAVFRYARNDCGKFYKERDCLVSMELLAQCSHAMQHVIADDKTVFERIMRFCSTNCTVNLERYDFLIHGPNQSIVHNTAILSFSLYKQRREYLKNFPFPQLQ